MGFRPFAGRGSPASRENWQRRSAEWPSLFTMRRGVGLFPEQADGVGFPIYASRGAGGDRRGRFRLPAKARKFLGTDTVLIPPIKHAEQVRVIVGPNADLGIGLERSPRGAQLRQCQADRP